MKQTSRKHLDDIKLCKHKMVMTRQGSGQWGSPDSPPASLTCAGSTCSVPFLHKEAAPVQSFLEDSQSHCAFLPRQKGSLGSPQPQAPPRSPFHGVRTVLAWWTLSALTCELLRGRASFVAFPQGPRSGPDPQPECNKR